MNEKMRILIAYDGSDCSKEALNDLARAGLPRETEALVVSVCDAVLPPPDTLVASNFIGAPEARLIAVEIEVRAEEARARALRAVEEAHDLGEQAVQQLRSHFPTWNLRAEAMVGTPALAVIKEADHWNADLIVVGTHGRTALGRLILGSVSHKVAKEAPCSVRVARCRVEKGDSPIRLVIGLDGSLDAKMVVQEVARRKWPAGSEALLIAASDLKSAGIGRNLPMAFAPASAQTAVGEMAHMRRMSEAAEEDLRAVAGLQVWSEIVEGDPKSVLMAEAKKFDADCIFIGCSAFNSDLETFMLGSVSEAVLDGAHCSVEVVRTKRTTEAN